MRLKIAVHSKQLTHTPWRRAPCVYMGGKSDPVSRCIIRSKCTGNDVISHRKSCNVLISQSNVYLSLVGPIKAMFGAIKPELLRLSKRQHLADFFSWGTKHGIRDETKGLLMRELGRLLKERT